MTLLMDPKSVKRREERAAKRAARYCKGCGNELVNPRQAQKYCNPSCRRKNYKWDTEKSLCIVCNENEKDKERSYCVRCTVLKRYNLTVEDFDNILLFQNYRCLVCYKELIEYLHIDHDHKCCDRQGSCGNCVRGILHQRCNTSLGVFEDNPETLRRAAEYLERFSVK